MNSKLLLSFTDSNDYERLKGVKHINPAAGTAQCKEFAQGLAGLTTNTYVGSSRVNKTELTAGGGSAVLQTATVWVKSPDGPLDYVGPLTELTASNSYTASYSGKAFVFRTNGSCLRVETDHDGELEVVSYAGDLFTAMPQKNTVANYTQISSLTNPNLWLVDISHPEIDSNVARTGTFQFRFPATDNFAEFNFYISLT